MLKWAFVILTAFTGPVGALFYVLACREPRHGIMSIAIIVGFAFGYPINWWLVASNMKHGMLTVRAESDAHSAHQEHGGHGGHGAAGPQPGPGAKAAMTALTTVILAAALVFIRLHG